MSSCVGCDAKVCRLPNGRRNDSSLLQQLCRRFSGHGALSCRQAAVCFFTPQQYCQIQLALDKLNKLTDKYMFLYQGESEAATAVIRWNQQACAPPPE